MAEAVEMLDHSVMSRALAEGTAIPLSRTITHFIRYQNAWWGSAPFAWVRLTDPQVCADFDAFAAKFDAADQAVEQSVLRHAPLPQVVGEERQ